MAATSATVDPARWDMVRWAAGKIIRSSVVTRYQLGLARQAGSVTGPPRASTPHGTCESAMNKAALIHLTRILDIELRPHGIRVNAVAPQLLDTPTSRATFPAEVMAHAVAPETIAGVIAFLVSDAAAPVSGAILPAYGA